MPPEILDRILSLLRGRLRTLLDFSGRFRAYFTEDFAYDPEASRRFLEDPGLTAPLSSLLERYESDPRFDAESAEKHLRALASERGVKAGLLINALRVGLTGQGVAPGLFDVMGALGRERTLARMRRLMQHLDSINSGDSAVIGTPGPGGFRP